MKEQKVIRDEWAAVKALLIAVVIGTLIAWLVGPVAGGSAAIFAIGMGLEKIYPIAKPKLSGATRVIPK